MTLARFRARLCIRKVLECGCPLPLLVRIFGIRQASGSSKEFCVIQNCYLCFLLFKTIPFV